MNIDGDAFLALQPQRRAEQATVVTPVGTDLPFHWLLPVMAVSVWPCASGSSSDGWATAGA